MGPNSEVDLLVVKAGVHRRDTAKRIYRHLRRVGFAVDVIVGTPEDIQRYGNCSALIIRTALKEGRTVYAV
jgi:UTP:GlnB (protein PII) uridylyltransferase